MRCGAAGVECSAPRVFVGASDLRAQSAPVGALLLVVSLLAATIAVAHEYVATVTLAEGQSTLLVGAEAYRPAEGVWLHHCDVVDTGANGFVQVETDDRGMIELGAHSRMVAHLPALHGQAPFVGPNYLLAGWAKLTVPKRAKGLPHRVDTQLLSVVIERGVAVLHVAADSVRLFVERGEVLARAHGSAALRTIVRAGSMYTIKAGLARGSVSGHASRDFIAAMPRAFRDTLHPRLASLKVRNVTPGPAPDYPDEEVREMLAVDDGIRLACARRH